MVSGAKHGAGFQPFGILIAVGPRPMAWAGIVRAFGALPRGRRRGKADRSGDDSQKGKGNYKGRCNSKGRSRSLRG